MAQDLVQENNISPFMSQSLQNLINIVDNYFKRRDEDETDIDTVEYYQYKSKLNRCVSLLVAIDYKNISYTEYKNDIQVLELFNNELNKIIRHMIISGELIIPKAISGNVRLKNTTKKGFEAYTEAGDYILQKIGEELCNFTEIICVKYNFLRSSNLSLLIVKKWFLDKRHRAIKDDIFGNLVEDVLIRRPEYSQILKKYYYLKFNGKLN